jgi:hypothetical protein
MSTQVCAAIALSIPAFLLLIGVVLPLERRDLPQSPSEVS